MELNVDFHIKEISDNLFERGQYEVARKDAEYVLSRREELTNDDCGYLYYLLGYTYIEEYRIVHDMIMNDFSELSLEELDDFDEKACDLYKKAFDYFKRALEYLDDDDILKPSFFSTMAYNCVIPAHARRYCIAAMCNPELIPEMTIVYKENTDRLLSGMNKSYKLFSDSPEEVEPDWEEKTQEEKESMLSTYKDSSFVNITKSYGVSPYIFSTQDEDHLNGCYDPTNTIFWVFTKNKVPECLTFPNGHPMANTLYIPHPLHPTQYLPMEQAEQMLFMDKVREFCYIAQCLGAKKIEFFTASGQKLSTHTTSDRSFSVSGNFRLHEMSGSYNNKKSRDYSSIDGNEINMNQTFVPDSAPYCPDDIEWYHKEKGWKDLVRQRLNGDLTHYDFYISSQETTNINESEEKAISIAYNNILMSLKANYKNTQETSIASSQHKTWRISVDFASKAEISSNATKYNSSSKQLTSEEKKLTSETQHDYGALTSEEQEYLTEYKECIVDGGVISDKERRLLSRLAKSLGISDARIQKLEALASTSCITEEEREYLNEYKACLAGGMISEKEQRLLSRLAKSLGISDERVKELQKM